MNSHKTPHRATKGIDPIKNPEDGISTIRDAFYAVSFFTNFKRNLKKLSFYDLDCPWETFPDHAALNRVHASGSVSLGPKSVIVYRVSFLE